MKLTIARHGETTHNRDHKVQGWYNSELSETGIEQAQELAAKITDKPDMVFASDLKRCQQTAAPIIEKFPDLQVLLDWRLRERYFAKLQDQPSKNVDWASFQGAAPSDSPDGAEPELYFEERVKSFIRDLSLYNPKTVLIITHGGVINRLGFILDPNYEARWYENVEFVELDIDPDDVRFVAAKRSIPWSPLS